MCAVALHACGPRAPRLALAGQAEEAILVHSHGSPGLGVRGDEQGSRFRGGHAHRDHAEHCRGAGEFCGAALAAVLCAPVRRAVCGLAAGIGSHEGPPHALRPARDACGDDVLCWGAADTRGGHANGAARVPLVGRGEEGHDCTAEREGQGYACTTLEFHGVLLGPQGPRLLA